MGDSPAFWGLLCAACNERSSAREEVALLAEPIEGAVFLHFTPSSPKILMCFHPSQVTTEMTLPLQLIPAESSTLSGRWEQGSCYCLFSHTSTFSYFVFPSSYSQKSFILVDQVDQVSLAASMPAWAQERGSKQCTMKPNVGTSPTGLKMADRALRAASTYLPGETRATVPAIPDHTTFFLFPQ